MDSGWTPTDERWTLAGLGNDAERCPVTLSDMKVTYAVEFTLPGEPKNGRDLYRKHLETILSVFAPRSSRIVDETWEATPEEDAAPSQEALAVGAVAFVSDQTPEQRRAAFHIVQEAAEGTF